MQGISHPDYEHIVVYPLDGKIYSKKTNKFLKGSASKKGYTYLSSGKRKISFHRIIYESFHNVKLQPHQQINHINHNPKDNCITNLELVTNQENSQWTRPRTGIYKGVQWNQTHNKWRAELKYNGENNFLGYYNTEIDAGKAYNDFALYLNQTYDCKYLLNTIKEPNYEPTPRNIPEDNKQSLLQNKSCSEYIGVQYNKSRNNYYSQIKYNGKSYFLGSNKDAIEVAKIYNQQAAYLNNQNPKVKYQLNDIQGYETLPKNIIEQKLQSNLEGMKSKYHGVTLHKPSNKWRAYIVRDKKQINIGQFDNELDAAKAYNLKAAQLNTSILQCGGKRLYKINPIQQT